MWIETENLKIQDGGGTCNVIYVALVAMETN